MTLTRDDAERAAWLSRLALCDEDLDRLTEDLARIVGFVEQLRAVDTDGVEPLFHPLSLELRRRPDAAEEGVGRRGLEGSMGYEDGLVRVPKVVE